MSRKLFIITAGVIIALMAIGSFADFQISTALFNTNSIFGNILAAYGELPLGIFIFVPVYILLFCHRDQKMVWKIVSIICGALMLPGALYFLLMNPTGYLRKYLWPGTSDILVAAIGLVIFAALTFCMIKYTKGADHKELRKLALICLVMVAGALIIINAIKVPWGRPRMRLIAVNDLAKFQPWWVAGGPQKATLLAAGVESDELKSFPSGHTANAALMLCLSFMALAKRNSKMDKVLFVVGAAFAAVVAFARIIMGAHFLTDVTFGFAVTFILYLILRLIFYKKALKTN